MMSLRPLTHIVRQNFRRNLRHFLLSALGIVLGISAFVFFLGLSGGVRRVVLGDIFPIRRVEVIAPKTTLTGAKIPLGEPLVARIVARPEVAQAFPKMKMAFPAMGWGRLLGNDVRFEVGGFCDGIDPILVQGDPGHEFFKDWEEAEKGKLAGCGPEPDNACPSDYYCGWDRKCHHRVPVLVSRKLMEIYNSSFAPAHGMPRFGTAQETLLRSRFRSLRFTIALGESVIRGSTSNLRAGPEHVEGMLVGISDKAMPIGITVPMGYVRRWNAAYAGEAAASEYSSVIVDVKDKDEVATLVSWIRKEGYETEESYAEQFSLVITIVTLLFLVISLVIVALSATNIAHAFFMLITERRREIGILRAVGASQRDVQAIILCEAGVMGLASGVMGVVAGVGAATTVDYLSARFLPDFPFKPTTFFEFTPGLLLCALAFSIVFCLLGALLPAQRAARMQPAQALTA
ncbi:MAG: ABC transporter permease [Deltaproteobacteria bacterium]|nr:ABC transporter permease [Deltaproteobacteria bacterium]